FTMAGLVLWRGGPLPITFQARLDFEPARVTWEPILYAALRPSRRSFENRYSIVRKTFRPMSIQIGLMRCTKNLSKRKERVQTIFPCSYWWLSCLCGKSHLFRLKAVFRNRKLTNVALRRSIPNG